MNNARHIKHYHHGGFSYPVSLGQRLYSIIFSPILLLILVAVLFAYVFHVPFNRISPDFSLLYFGQAIGATFLRLFFAYVFALVCSIPLALLVVRSPLFERILLPVFDILESIPILAFFPVVILFFVRINMLNIAAVFIIFVSMLWNIVFSLVGGLKAIPIDFKYVGRIFKLTPWQYFKKIELQAIVPYIVTGSLLAWAQGWNMIIVAEVLHTYIPGGGSGDDLFGIGSALVHAVATGNNTVFLLSLSTLVIGIAIMNLLVWQKLLHYAERFKFE